MPSQVSSKAGVARWSGRYARAQGSRQEERDEQARAGRGGSLLDELVRDGARQMLAAALQAEVAAYVEAFAGRGRRGGSPAGGPQRLPQQREVLTGGGAVPVTGAAGQRQAHRPETGRAQAVLLGDPAGVGRKSPQVAEVLPLLYLHGLSSGDFAPALEQFLGSSAGLSAATITRLTAQWQDEAARVRKRDLSGIDYVYLWVDGIVRHEALCDRVGVGDLHRPVVVAAG